MLRPPRLPSPPPNPLVASLTRVALLAALLAAALFLGGTQASVHMALGL